MTPRLSLDEEGAEDPPAAIEEPRDGDVGTAVELARRGVQLVDSRVSDLEKKMTAEMNSLERQSKKKCLVMISSFFKPKAGLFFTDADLFHIAKGLIKRKFQIHLQYGDVTQVHPIGGGGSKMIIMAFGESRPLDRDESLETNFFDRRVVLELSLDVDTELATR